MSEFSEVGFGSCCARDGKGGRTAAGGEEGQGGAVGMMGMMGTCGLLNVKVILDMNPVLVLVTVLEPRSGAILGLGDVDARMDSGGPRMIWAWILLGWVVICEGARCRSGRGGGRNLRAMRSNKWRRVTLGVGEIGPWHKSNELTTFSRSRESRRLLSSLCPGSLVAQL